MEKNIKQLEGCFQEIEITLSKEELQPHYEEAYKKARPHIVLQGFRKGKVPLNMVKKIYGKQIEADANQDIISDVFGNVAKEEEIKIIGQPELHDLKMNDDESLTFAIKYEIIPEVQLKDYKSLVINEPVHAVTDDEIEQALNQIRTQYASFEVAQEVEDENFVVGINLQEIDEDTRVSIINGENRDEHVFLGDSRNLDPELKNLLIGKKGGDEFEYQIESDVPDEEEPIYKVTVNEIQKVIPAELTAEFIKEYTNDKFDSVDDLKEEIGFELQEQWDSRSRQEMESQVIEKLVEMHSEIEAPEAAVLEGMNNMLNDFKKRYKDSPEVQKMKVEDMEDGLRYPAERAVKWELIRNQIVKAENLEVEDHDVDHIFEKEAARYKTSVDTLKATAMQNPQFLDSILAKKVMDLVLEFSETTEVPFEGDNQAGGDFVEEDPTIDHNDEQDTAEEAKD